MDMLLRSSQEEAPSQFGQASLADTYYKPSIQDVVDAYSNEALKGTGTGYADVIAQRVKSAEETGNPLTEQEYRLHPDYNPNIPYYNGMTNESLQELTKYHKTIDQDAFIINHASRLQSAVGMGAGFATGIIEPKNLAIGAATALTFSAIFPPASPVTAPAGEVAGATVGSLRRIMQIRRMAGRYSTLAARGGAEGLAAAAAVEPSNRYSASILHQDYGMQDSLFNIATSAALGAGFHTIPKFIQERWTTHGANAPDIMMHEHDLAVAQMAEGKKVDVGMVEKSANVDIEKRPVHEQAVVAEKFVRYTETPEFKSLFEGSKVVDESGAPLRVYHGTGTQEIQLKAGDSDAIFFSNSTETANTYTGRGDAPNIRPAYLGMKNPLEIDAEGFDWHSIEYKGEIKTADEIATIAKKLGHDGLIIKNVTDDLNAEKAGGRNGNATYAVFSPDQVIPAFGKKTLPEITRQISEESASATKQAVLSSVDPKASTAIDIEAADRLDSYENQLSPSEPESVFGEYMDEIARLKEEGMLTADDEKAMLDAFDSLNEADIESAYNAAYACLTRG